MKKILLTLLCFCSIMAPQAQVSKTINVTTAGTLSSLLTTEEKNNVTNLTVSGNIDARDFQCMRFELLSLSTLDLANTTIMAYTGTGGTVGMSFDYNANTIPMYFINENVYLESIILPLNCTSIDDYAFSNCTELISVVLSNNLQSIGSNSFEGCPISTINFPNSLQTIGNYAFSSCALQTLNLPNSITNLGEAAFYNCGGIKTLEIPSGITVINNSTFSNLWNLTSITFPNTIISIGDYAFESCLKLTSINLPSSLTSIGENSFAYCYELQNITLPIKLSQIGPNAFLNTPIIKIISLNPIPPKISSTSFDFNLGGMTILVPYGTKASYLSAYGWKKSANYIENVVTISTNAASEISTTAKLNASIDLIATTPITAHGFCWNKTGSPTISDSIVNNGTKTTLGAYSSTTSKLSPSTTYYVKAFATDGERTVYGNEVTFTTASLPSAAGTVSGSTTVCQGQNSVTYTVQAITSATTYIWTLPTGITGTSTTNSITVNYAKSFTSGIINVKGHNEWGDGPSSNLAITANLLPADAGVITGTTSVCQGESSVTYTVPVIENALSYTWTLPTGATGTSTTNSITLNYAKTALSGNVTVKGHNDCGDGVVSTLPITVNKLPVLSLTNKTVKSSGSVQLNPSISYAGTGTLSYRWTPSTGLNDSTLSNPSATLSKPTTYTLTVTSSNGCSASADLSVAILPADAGSIVGSSAICQGEGLITFTVPSIESATSYIWTLPTGATGTSTTNSITVNFAKTAISGSITVKGRNTIGDGTASSLAVTVNKLPIISTTNKNIICGGSVQLNPSISYSGTGTLSYLWTPTTGLDNPTISNPTATLTAPTTYTLTVTSSNGCSASAEMTVSLSKMSAPGIGVVGISNNKNIVVWNKPVSIGIDSYQIYRETNVSNVYAKIGAVSYDSLSVFVDTQSNPDVQSNKYKISILDKNGVETDQSAAHKTMHLSINKGTGSSWNLIWEAYEGFAVSTYNIYRGTTATNLALLGSTSGSSTQFNDLNAPAGNVYYQMEVINPNSVNPSKVSAYASKNSAIINYAASRSNLATNAETGLNNSNMDNFVVYPNPSRGEVTISMEKVKDANYSITVSNTLGQKVYSSKLMSDKTKLDFSQFGKQGIYFVQVIDSKGVIVGRRKVVVE